MNRLFRPDRSFVQCAGVLLLLAGSILSRTTPALAQSTITTIAGGLDPFNGSQPVTTHFGNTESVISDGKGGFYFSVTTPRHSVYHVFNGAVTIIAGSNRSGFSGDGGPATSARLNEPHGLALDASGNLLIADRGNHRIRKVTPAGIISTVAGAGTPGYSGDDGPATSAQLNFPWGIAIDASGNLLIADYGNHRIRRVTPGGVITTVAGNGNLGFSGDQGPATSAQLRGPRGVALDGSGNLLIADSENHRIRRVTPAGAITTVAGNGTASLFGDNGAAVNAGLSLPTGITVDGSGNLLIADTNNNRIRRVTPAGVITTVAGSLSGFAGDGGSALAARLSQPSGIAVDSTGNLLIADRLNLRIRSVGVSAGVGLIFTVAGTWSSGFNGDNLPATSAQLYSPSGLFIDAGGNLLIADTNNNRIRKVSPAGTISTLAGGGSIFPGDGGPATSASLFAPSATAMDSAGNVYITDCNNRIRRVNTAGTISVFSAGPWLFCYSYYDYYIYGDSTGGEMAFDPSGDLIVSDTFNSRIRKVTPNGVVSIVAGTGTYGSTGDGGAATSAQIGYPRGVVVDAAGNIYFSDWYNNLIRKITPAGIITTVAGNGTYGYGGDGGPATSAQLFNPTGLALDASGNLYIADSANNRVRRVAPDGIITTVAGDGSYGLGGDGGPPTLASLSNPTGLAVDSTGNLYIGDTDNQRVRKVVFAPTVPTLAGIVEPFGSQGATLTVSLTGNSFTAPLTLNVGTGITVSNVRVSSETLATATITIASNASLGNRNVTVTTSLGTSGNFSFEVKPPFPDLAITSSQTGNLEVGFQGTLAMTIQNKGVAPTSGPITVNDTLPVGLTWVSGTGTDWSCSNSAQAVTCENLQPLAPGASTTLNLNVAVGTGAGSRVTHTPVVTVDGDLVLSDNTTSIGTNVVIPSINFQYSLNLVSGTQATLGLSLSTTLNHDVTGKLTLVFSPDAVNPADDPAIQFATGGREVTFTIASGTLQARFGSNTLSGPIAFQTGTVAGTLSFSVALQTGTIQIPFSSVRTLPRRAPTIHTIRTEAKSASEVNVAVSLSSTSREVTHLTLQFQGSDLTIGCGATPGCTGSNNSLTLDVKSLFDAWFTTDRLYGGTNVLTVPLVKTGSARPTVTVTLRNGTGTSNPMSFVLP
jgi:trimeric autotransporter adhesin